MGCIQKKKQSVKPTTAPSVRSKDNDNCPQSEGNSDANYPSIMEYSTGQCYHRLKLKVKGESNKKERDDPEGRNQSQAQPILINCWGKSNEMEQVIELVEKGNKQLLQQNLKQNPNSINEQKSEMKINKVISLQNSVTKDQNQQSRKNVISNERFVQIIDEESQNYYRGKSELNIEIKVEVKVGM